MELPPFSCGHGGVVAGLSTDVDWDGVLGVTPAISSSNIRIVGVILYVLSDLGAVFVVPFPILWVWDVDGVEVATFKLIVNEACRCSVGIFHHTSVVDVAELVFLDQDRANSQLRGEWSVWGVVIGGGIVGNRGVGWADRFWWRCWLNELSEASGRHGLGGMVNDEERLKE